MPEVIIGGEIRALTCRIFLTAGHLASWVTVPRQRPIRRQTTLGRTCNPNGSTGARGIGDGRCPAATTSTSPPNTPGSGPAVATRKRSRRQTLNPDRLLAHALNRGALQRPRPPPKRDPERITKRLIAQLESLGHKVTLEELPRPPKEPKPQHPGGFSCQPSPNPASAAGERHKPRHFKGGRGGQDRGRLANVWPPALDADCGRPRQGSRPELAATPNSPPSPPSPPPASSRRAPGRRSRAHDLPIRHRGAGVHGARGRHDCAGDRDWRAGRRVLPVRPGRGVAGGRRAEGHRRSGCYLARGPHVGVGGPRTASSLRRSSRSERRRLGWPLVRRVRLGGGGAGPRPDCPSARATRPAVPARRRNPASRLLVAGPGGPGGAAQLNGGAGGAGQRPCR